VPPGDLGAFVTAVRGLLHDRERAVELGEAGRRWVVENASPTAIGVAYDQLMTAIAAN
jgi:glycosyltransferase involved in cell wall biosynthesis